MHMTLKVSVLRNGRYFRETSCRWIFTIKDQDAFRNVKSLAKHEGLLVGSSSGAALQGALNLKAQLSEGTIVVVFPDGSDRYMSKQIFNYEENDYE